MPTGTINNDDSATVTLSPLVSSANEGDSGTTPLTFEVSVDNPVQGGFSIAYTSDDGSATVADNDYSDNDASLSFADLDITPKTITVLAVGDTVVEGDETFTVALGAISGLATGIDANDVGVATPTNLTGTILNDDANQAVTLSATKTVAGDPIVGGLITYLITLTNLGPGSQDDNPGAELTDILPPSLSLLSASADAGAAVANLATNTVTWNGSLAANASVNLTIKAGILAAAEGTTIANQASIAFDANNDNSNDSSGLSDDPTVDGSSDPTLLNGIFPAGIPTLSLWSLLVLSAGLIGFGRRRSKK